MLPQQACITYSLKNGILSKRDQYYFELLEAFLTFLTTIEFVLEGSVSYLHFIPA